METFSTGSWHNWAGNQSCEAEVLSASSLEDLQAIVRKAAAEGRTVRVAGGGALDPTSFSYSWSPVVTNESNVIVRMPDLNAGSVDLEKKQVTVEAGMTMSRLADFVGEHGLSFVTIPIIGHITVGGAVAAGCHGSGHMQVPFCDLAVAMEIVTADGTVARFSEEDDPELMRAARVNLGSFGLIYRITLQCVDRFKLETHDQRLDMEEVIDRLEQLVPNNDYFGLMWWPFNRELFAQCWNRVPWETPNKDAPNLFSFLMEFFASEIGNLALERVLSKPSRTPEFLQHLFNEFIRDHHRTAPALEVFQFERCFFRFVAQAYAIDVGENFETAKKAWRFAANAICRYAKPAVPGSCYSGDPSSYSGTFPCNMVVEARFIRNSDSYLSPAVGFSHTMFIEIMTYYRTEDYQGFFDEVEQYWLSLGGRPHWGKLASWSSLDLAALYGENLTRFNDIRKRLDPGGVFLNDFLRGVFAQAK